MNRDEQNRFLLNRLSDFMNNRADFIDEGMISEITSSFSLSEEEAFRMLLAGAMGLDLAENREHFEIYRADFPRMAKILSQSAYDTDPYLKLIPRIRASSGNVELRHDAYKPYEVFVCGDYREYPDGAVLPQIGCFQTEFRYPAIYENGRLWMTATPNEMETIRPAAEKAFGKTLTLGLGLGYFALLASENPKVERVTAVEMNRDVILLFETHILPHFPNRQKIHIIHGDAFEKAPEMYLSGEYDFCFSDLWHDAGDGREMYLRLRQLESLNPNMKYEYWIEDTIKWYL